MRVEACDKALIFRARTSAAKVFVAAVGQLRKLQTVTRPVLRLMRPMQYMPVLQKNIRAVLAIWILSKPYS